QQSWDPSARLDRLALLRLLDTQPDPVFVVEPGGRVAAANHAALDAVGGPDREPIREALTRVGCGESVDGLAVEPLADAGFVCRLPAQGGSLATGSIGGPSMSVAAVSPDSRVESSPASPSGAG